MERKNKIAEKRSLYIGYYTKYFRNRKLRLFFQEKKIIWLSICAIENIFLIQ